MAEITFGNEIEKITHVDADTFHVRLKYTDGFEGDVDLSDVFRKPVGLALEIQRGSLFDRCFIEDGALAWPNGYELCPDALRAQAIAVMRRKNSTRKRVSSSSRERHGGL
jgi:hypothetical protein